MEISENSEFNAFWAPDQWDPTNFKNVLSGPRSLREFVPVFKRLWWHNSPRIFVAHVSFRPVCAHVFLPNHTRMRSSGTTSLHLYA